MLTRQFSCLTFEIKGATISNIHFAERSPAEMKNNAQNYLLGSFYFTLAGFFAGYFTMP